MNLRRSFSLVGLTAILFCLPLHAATVHGTVLDPQNKPVVGASVILMAVLQSAPQLAHTGEDGTWQIEMPDAQVKPPSNMGRLANMVGAVVIAPGLGFGAKMGTAGEALDVLLPASSSIDGVVRDEKGAPVAGVALKIVGFYSSAFDPIDAHNENKIPFGPILGAMPNAPQFPLLSATTDSQGKWHFDGVPQATRIVVSLSDDRFSASDVDVMAGTTDTVIKAAAGAAVKGRVLLPNGQPAPGIIVLSGADRMNKSDAQGQFLLSRLPPGSLSISFVDQSKNLLFTNKNIEALQPGETRDIGDISLPAGVRLTGQVVDETGKGIAKASVSLNGEQTETGPDGHFELKAPTGQSWVMVGKEGFLGSNGNADQTQLEVKIGPDEKEYVVGPIKLRRGVYVSGTALDETGAAAAGAVLNAGAQWENAGTTMVEKDGSFRFGPLMPGKEVTLHAAGTWDLTREVKFTAPSLAGEAAAQKLNLKLKKITLSPVKGRLVSAEGTPIANVRVRYRIYTDVKHESWSGGEVSSDDKGAFSFGALRPEQTPSLDSIKSGGYVLVKADPALRNGDNWSLGDIIISPLDGVITGEVVDATGAAVPGAEIALAGRYPLKTATSDAQGHFTVDKLPHGEATLIAVSEHAFARATIKVGQDARITLEDRPTPTTADAEKMLRSKANGYDGRQTVGVVPPLDPGVALSLLRKKNGDTPDPAQVVDLIAGLARRDPATAATWGLAQWQKIPAENRGIENGTALARAVIPFDREFAVQWLGEARPKIASNDFSAEAANKYILLAGLAGLLRDPSADTLLDLGLTAADRSLKGDKALNYADDWGRDVGATPELLERLTQDMPQQQQLAAFAGAIQTLAPTDLAAAQTLLSRLAEVRQSAAVKAADTKQEESRRSGGDWHETSDEIQGRAQAAIALSLASQPGPAALEMANKITDVYRRDTILLRIARRKLSMGNQTDAKAVLLPFTSDEGYWENDSAAAGVALSFDKALADQLFAGVYKLLFRPATDDEGNSDDYRPTAAAYAFFHAPVEPARSRLILENEWEWRQAGRKPDDNDNRDWQMRPLALAMGRLDLPRALEMLGQLKDSYGQNDDAKWQIGIYLMTGGKTEVFNRDDGDDF